MRFLFIGLIILILSSCDLDVEKGIVTVSNSTSQFVNVNIDGCSNLSLLTNGQSVDCWFETEIASDLICNEADGLFIAKEVNESGNISYMNDSKQLYFKTNYRYEIRIVKATYEASNSFDDSLIFIFVEPGIKFGGKKGDEDFYDYPANYY